MLKERRNYIKHLVASLKKDYDTSSLKGLQQVAADRRIVVIESPRIVVPLVSLEFPEPVIFTRKFMCSHAELWVFGHELGHALLHDNDSNPSFESEANFFQEQLNGPTPYFCLMKDSFLTPRSPFRDLEYIIKGYFTDRPFMNILNKAYMENIDKYYNEMNN